VRQPPVDTARIRRVAALTYGAAEAYIALGERMSSSRSRSHQAPTSVVRELDQVSEHLLALATHLSRLAAAIEQAGPPRTPSKGGFADPSADS
jgi:hypothetical protein